MKKMCVIFTIATLLTTMAFSTANAEVPTTEGEFTVHMYRAVDESGNLVAAKAVIESGGSAICGDRTMPDDRFVRYGEHVSKGSPVYTVHHNLNCALWMGYRDGKLAAESRVLGPGSDFENAEQVYDHDEQEAGLYHMVQLKSVQSGQAYARQEGAPMVFAEDGVTLLVWAIEEENGVKVAQLAVFAGPPVFEGRITEGSRFSAAGKLFLIEKMSPIATCHPYQPSN